MSEFDRQRPCDDLHRWFAELLYPLACRAFYQEYSISPFYFRPSLFKPLLFYLFGRYQPVKGVLRLGRLFRLWLLQLFVTHYKRPLFAHYLTGRNIAWSATIVGQIIIIDWVIPCWEPGTNWSLDGWLHCLI
jgi:hypothetical protein